MAKFIQKRKALQFEVNCQSEIMHRILLERGGVLVGALQRVATLREHSIGQKHLLNAIDTLFNPIFERFENDYLHLKRESDILVRQGRKALKRLNVKENELKFAVPESFCHILELTHPSMLSVADRVSAMDTLATRLENYWYCALIDDEQYDGIRRRLTGMILRICNEIYEQTNRLRASTKSIRSTRHSVINQLTAFNQQAAYESDRLAEEAATAEAVDTADSTVETDNTQHHLIDDTFSTEDMTEMLENVESTLESDVIVDDQESDANVELDEEQVN
ncbi:hypothetical protein ACP3V5_17010 [Vibrio maritimus]